MKERRTGTDSQVVSLPWPVFMVFILTTTGNGNLMTSKLCSSTKLSYFPTWVVFKGKYIASLVSCQSSPRNSFVQILFRYLIIRNNAFLPRMGSAEASISFKTREKFIYYLSFLIYNYHQVNHQNHNRLKVHSLPVLYTFSL